MIVRFLIFLRTLFLHTVNLFSIITFKGFYEYTKHYMSWQGAYIYVDTDGNQIIPKRIKSLSEISGDEIIYGSGHSFHPTNKIVIEDQNKFITLEEFDYFEIFNSNEQNYVKVSSGMKMEDVVKRLHKLDYDLRITGSYMKQSAGGVAKTKTHGTAGINAFFSSDAVMTYDYETIGNVITYVIFPIFDRHQVIYEKYMYAVNKEYALKNIEHIFDTEHMRLILQPMTNNITVMEWFRAPSKKLLINYIDLYKYAIFILSIPLFILIGLGWLGKLADYALKVFNTWPDRDEIKKIKKTGIGSSGTIFVDYHVAYHQEMEMQLDYDKIKNDFYEIINLIMKMKNVMGVEIRSSIEKDTNKRLLYVDLFLRYEYSERDNKLPKKLWNLIKESVIFHQGKIIPKNLLE